ncbi:hypothetical protein [Pseudomonas gingeri]|uniref:hypothetical protein n=1 Tax=Pseudomonas gingeri TaxID=117681 RepID=UPI0015A31C24|nr:hypothetical protein [Pseudomonas gingeri]
MIDLMKKSEALAYLYHALLLHEIGVDADLIKANLLENAPNAYRPKYAFRDVGLLPVDKGADSLEEG